MRNHRRIAMIAAALISAVSFATPTVEAGGAFGVHIGSGGFGVSVGFGDWGVYTSSWSDPYWSINFNATLSGYGQWTWVSGLGRVWRPWVAASWRPYTHGRWVSTSCGWTWVAYEPWGYVPHHYGSWAYTSFGWVWVPGYGYSCANVVWVRSGGYVGWYARPPWGWSHAHHGFRHGYDHGYGDGFGNGYRSGYHDGWTDARYATFVDWRHFGSDYVAHHSVSHTIASGSRIEGLANAPTRDEVRRRGGGTMTQTQLSRRTVTVDGREVTIARPEGVARSIERNAAQTVSSALSRQAIERRQPLVMPRTASGIGEASSSRPAFSSREPRSAESQQSAHRTSPQIRQPAISVRSTSEWQQEERRAGSGTASRITGSSSSARRGTVDALQLKTRTTDEVGLVGNRGSRSAPSASQRSRSPSQPQPVMQTSRQRSSSRQPSLRVSAPESGQRHSSAGQSRTTAARQNSVQSEKTTSARSRQQSTEKGNDESSRRRRR
jgi:hypothetical protein